MPFCFFKTKQNKCYSIRITESFLKYLYISYVCTNLELSLSSRLFFLQLWLSVLMKEKEISQPLKLFSAFA